MNQAELYDRVERIMPGASLGMISLPSDLRMVMVRGAGSKIYDAAGREYLDCMLGSGPMLLGHAHPEVVEAVQQQVACGSTFFAMTEPAVLLAEKVVEAAPCGEAIRFQTTGSDATFSAMRLARAATGRDVIVKFEGGWHGNHDIGQMSAAPGQPLELPAPTPDCDGLPAGSFNEVLVTPFNDLPALDRLFAEQGQKVAAVIAEPLQRVIKPEAGFLEGVNDIAHRHGAVVIYDEIVTGFRIAWGGAQERYGVLPDLACYGKAMAGGFTLSAVVGSADLMAYADPNRKGKEPYCFLSGTLTGNPVSCSAGLAALRVLERDGVYPRLHQISEAVAAGLEQLAAERGLPVRVLGDGPVLQLFFTDHDIRNWRDCLHADKAKAVAFGYEMLRQSIYLAPGGKIYLSLAHTDADIDRLLAAAAPSMDAVVKLPAPAVAAR